MVRVRLRLRTRLPAVVALAALAGMAPAGHASAGGRAADPPGTRTVKEGETLTAVARALGVSVADLAAANGISNVHLVRAGARLIVPGGAAGADGGPAIEVPAAPPTVHRTVAKGETLSAVARALGVSVADLAAANGITNVHRVRAGTRLVVPTGAVGGRPASTAGLPERLRAQPDRLALIPHFDAAAHEFGVPADLFKAMTWLESGWQNTKVSSTKAVGIGQLMPDTVAFVNDVLLKADLDPKKPEHNIRMSARFLAYLLHQQKGDASLALASYYQGLASVRRDGQLAETRRYVANVLALRKKF